MYHSLIRFSYIHNFVITPQLVRALHQYRRGQGFESCTSLNFFQAFLFATAKVASITAMIFFHIILHPAVLCIYS